MQPWFGDWNQLLRRPPGSQNERVGGRGGEGNTCPELQNAGPDNWKQTSLPPLRNPRLQGPRKGRPRCCRPPPPGWAPSEETLGTDLFFAAAARSLCRRFLNQLPTWVGVSPVAWASSRFLLGLGYGSCRYHSRSRCRVRSLKQCVFCSPSQMVRGRGNFFLTRYLSTGPRGRPRSFSASW